MCGVCGIYGPGKHEDVVAGMVGVLSHRGPDDSGVWVEDGIVGLGHARLSILDLSPLGRQPMHSGNDRYVIVYNGEVYNHLELRSELSGYSFQSTSDTETMLAAFCAWGVEASLHRFVGMFAFALWDKHEKRLYLVRDRMGIKPLYYAQMGNGQWAFASELKAVRKHPQFIPEIDRDALALFFRHNYIPAPYSIYGRTKKLLPGEMAVISEDGIRAWRWWDVEEVWQSGCSNPHKLSDREAVDALEALLKDAVSLRMLSDVSLGAFLSGGIDSSTIVALMQSQSSMPVKTFSIGFDEDGFNEAHHAAAVAENLGTDHTELFVSAKDLLDMVPSIPKFWDEPFADSSQIPTSILSRLTREHVTVSLSGDGGDELFSGYQRYFYASHWGKIEAAPLPLRKLARAALKATPASFFKLLGPMGPKVAWRLDVLGLKDFQEFYRYLLSHFKRPTDFVLGSTEPPTPLSKQGDVLEDRFSYMTLRDLQMYLPDDILTKVDRASMGVGLEARVPLIDHRVVEFASRTPIRQKVRNGSGKWLLKEVLYRHVPKEIVDRPKMGFGVPIELWMKNELRDWCESLIDINKIKRQGLIDHAKVERMWKEYLAGESNWNYCLWDVFMFQAWLEEWGS